MDSLPTQLKKARLKKGYSQSDVADMLGISRQSLSSWENGHVCPDFYNLRLLSQIYEMPIDDFIKDNRGLQIEFDREPFIQVFRQFQQRDNETSQQFELCLLLIVMLSAVIPIVGIATSLYAIWWQVHRPSNTYQWLPFLSLVIAFIINGSLLYFASSCHWLNLASYQLT